MTTGKLRLRVLGAVIAMLALAAGAWSGGAGFAARPNTGSAVDARGSGGSVTTAADSARPRISSTISAKQGAVQVIIYHSVAAKSALQKLAPGLHSAGFALPDGSTESFATVDGADLVKIASVPGVAWISGVKDIRPDIRTAPDQPVRQLPKGKLSKPAGKPVSAVRSDGYDGKEAPTVNLPDSWYDQSTLHNAAQAWSNGYDGSGTVVAVVDTGVDFGTPDMQGTYARIPSGPYAGWPYAYDTGASAYWESFGQAETVETWNSGFTGQFVDTSLTLTAPANVTTTHAITVPLNDRTGTATHNYIMPRNSKSGVVHVGFHPDAALGFYWTADGGQPALVVVDANTAGVYDTVYVDMDDDHNFNDDVAISKTNPVAALDWSSDGMADESAGLLYWIADGTHANPGAYTWQQDSGPRIAGAGDLVAFMFTNDIDPNIGIAHGLYCASAVVAQGVQTGDGTQGEAAQPFAVSPGRVWGTANKAKLAAFSVATFYDFSVSANLYAALGPDGVAGTGDEAQVSSNSISAGFFDSAGWSDAASRYYAQINYHVNPNITYLFSAGNDGPGYGITDEPAGNTTIMVGASTSYGNTTAFEPISTTDQIVWGDTVNWSNAGPTGNGRWGPSVNANGAWGPGDVPVNEVGDGNGSWFSWGGTSRSTPAAAGVVALIVDAFKQAHGRLPTYSETRHILMSTATDNGNNAYRQGAGVVDALRATDAASENGGIVASPSAWQPGSFGGTTYGENDSFMNIMAPGASSSGVISLTNTGAVATNVAVSATILQATQVVTLNLTTDSSIESSYDPARPDYLPHLFRAADIPAGTALMQVQLAYPYEQFNPQLDYDPDHRNQFYIYAYDWSDLNHNGKLWNDGNSNGVVNASELEAREYNLIDKGYNYYDDNQLTVGYPAARMHNGIYIGVGHSARIDAVAHANLTIRVTFYKQVPWNWITLGAHSASIAAHGAYALHATASVPAGTAPGMYEGMIMVQPQLNVERGLPNATSSQIPVSIAVAAGSASFSFGGQGRQRTPYDNNVMWGFTGAEYEGGDGRDYFANVPASEAGPGKFWLVHTDWTNYTVPTTTIPTDIDTLLYGPEQSDLSDSDARFGPYTLGFKGGSANTQFAAGLWTFQTTTGTTEEWVSGNLSAGLNQVLLHSVTASGKQIDEPVKGQSGVLSVNPYPITFNQTCGVSIPLTVSATLPITPLSVIAGGLSQPISSTKQITQGATNVYTITLSNPMLLDVQTRTGGAAPAQDVDLAVFRVDGGQLVSVGSSTSSTADEEVRQILPAAGTYRIEVNGYAVSPSPGTFLLVLNNIAGNQLHLQNAPGSLLPGQSGTIELATVDNLAPGTYNGAVAIGPAAAPGASLIPITVHVTGACSVTPTRTPEPDVEPFSDVNPSDYYYQGVNGLYARGAISGYSDNTFRPFNSTTRAQLVKIVVLSEGFTIQTPATASFTDVSTRNPFFSFVETAKALGLISGYNVPNGVEFRPGNNVTRAQIAKIVVVAEHWAIVTPATQTFRDVSPSNPFYGWVETAYSHNIISGYTCGVIGPCPGSYFNPGANATRGQVAKIVFGAITGP